MGKKVCANRQPQAVKANKHKTKTSLPNISSSSKRSDRFINTGANKFQNKFIHPKKRAIIKERALRPYKKLKANRPIQERLDIRDIKDMIIGRGWHKLTQESETTGATFIREFYANAIVE